MRKFRAAVLGATGMVGQNFIARLRNHPWFELSAVAASAASANKTYIEAIRNRNHLGDALDSGVGNMVVLDADKDAQKIAQAADIVFCAVEADKKTLIELEERYARLECAVVSNTSANRSTPDVPMVIPELNADHLGVIKYQRQRLSTKRGFIATKSNCSLQSYVPPLYALKEFVPTSVLVCTYQAVSGAGKTLESFAEMQDNIIPYIIGEEEKSRFEPQKIFGMVENGVITNAMLPKISARCVRVPVSDGHLAAVFASFEKKPEIEQIKQIWSEYAREPQTLGLPSAPKQFLHYYEQEDFPQTRLHRNVENGMAVCLGRLKNDPLFDVSFVGLSHNTVRGAAGGAVLLAELLCAKGYIE